MQKKLRKEIEQQLAVTIAYFLKKQHAQAATKMVKVVKSSAKDISKKFVKEIAKISKLKEKETASVKSTSKKSGVSKKTTAKKAVKKASGKAKK